MLIFKCCAKMMFGLLKKKKKKKRCVWVKNFKRCVLLRTIFFNTKAVRERERSRESVRERLGKSLALSPSRCVTDFLC